MNAIQTKREALQSEILRIQKKAARLEKFKTQLERCAFDNNQLLFKIQSQLENDQRERISGILRNRWQINVVVRFRNVTVVRYIDRPECNGNRTGTHGNK